MGLGLSRRGKSGRIKCPSGNASYPLESICLGSGQDPPFPSCIGTDSLGEVNRPIYLDGLFAASSCLTVLAALSLPPRSVFQLARLRIQKPMSRTKLVKGKERILKVKVLRDVPPHPKILSYRFSVNVACPPFPPYAKLRAIARHYFLFDAPPGTHFPTLFLGGRGATRPGDL